MDREAWFRNKLKPYCCCVFSFSGGTLLGGGERGRGGEGDTISVWSTLIYFTNLSLFLRGRYFWMDGGQVFRVH